MTLAAICLCVRAIRLTPKYAKILLFFAFYFCAKNVIFGRSQSAEVARSFVELHRASHRKDQLIGWYASSKHADLSAVRAFVLKENSAAAGVQLVVDLDEGEGHGEVTTQIMTAFDAETGAASLSDISFVVECSVAAYNAAKILFEGVRETTGEFALADDGCDALCSDFVSPAAGKCSDLQQLHQFSQSILKTRLK